MTYTESDEAIIESVDTATNKVTLATELKYFHYGAAAKQSYTYGSIDMRAAVLYMSRNVKIHCRVQPMSTIDDHYGRIYLENVEINGCGTHLSDYACIKL